MLIFVFVAVLYSFLLNLGPVRFGLVWFCFEGGF